MAQTKEKELMARLETIPSADFILMVVNEKKRLVSVCCAGRLPWGPGCIIILYSQDGGEEKLCVRCWPNYKSTIDTNNSSAAQANVGLHQQAAGGGRGLSKYYCSSDWKISAGWQMVAVSDLGNDKRAPANTRGTLSIMILLLSLWTHTFNQANLRVFQVFQTTKLSAET